MSDAGLVARRRPWLAGVLSGLQPGLGQLYNGQPAKAILFALFPFLAIGPLLIVLLLYAPLHAPYNVILPFLLVAALLLAIVRDATHVAGEQAGYTLKPYNKWYVYLLFSLFFGLIIQPAGLNAFRQVIQAFEIPAGSMAPTLLAGDHVLADKSTLWSSQALQRGEIIVFTLPEDESRELFRRIIGLPGETIHIRNKIVYVNDRALDDSAYTQRIDPGILEGTMNARDNVGPVTVPDAAYFVMGDNRDQSLDSRFFGSVPHSRIIGKMLCVYWSWDQHSNRVRWDRIGLRF